MTIGREGADIEYERIAAGGNGHAASGYLAKPVVKQQIQAAGTSVFEVPSAEVG